MAVAGTRGTRGWAAALGVAGLVALAACLPAAPAADSAEIAATVLPDSAPAEHDGPALPATDAQEPGTTTDTAPPPEPAAEPAPTSQAGAPAPPPALARAQADCVATGGRLVPVGAGRAQLVCLRDTRDAGRRCAARDACEGECLARSGTCAPVTPLFGCHDVFNTRGARVTECMQ